MMSGEKTESSEAKAQKSDERLKLEIRTKFKSLVVPEDLLIIRGICLTADVEMSMVVSYMHSNSNHFDSRSVRDLVLNHRTENEKINAMADHMKGQRVEFFYKLMEALLELKPKAFDQIVKEMEAGRNPDA